MPDRICPTPHSDVQFPPLADSAASWLRSPSVPPLVDPRPLRSEQGASTLTHRCSPAPSSVGSLPTYRAGRSPPSPSGGPSSLHAGRFARRRQVSVSRQRELSCSRYHYLGISISTVQIWCHAPYATYLLGPKLRERAYSQAARRLSSMLYHRLNSPRPCTSGSH